LAAVPQGGLEVVGIGDLLEGLLQQLLAGIAEDIAELVVDPQPPSVQRGVGDADSGLLEGNPETLLTLSKLLLRLLLLGEVVCKQYPRNDAPYFIIDRGGVGPKPEVGTIGKSIKILPISHLFARCDGSHQRPLAHLIRSSIRVTYPTYAILVYILEIT
jgi:hypothetical protein